MKPPTLNDVYVARERICAAPAAHAVAAPSAAGRSDRPVHLGEAREPQPDVRVQGAWRLQPRRRNVARRTRQGHRDGQHRQSRPVDRHGLAHPRRAVHGVRARRQQPREERRDARLRRHVEEGGKDFDEARERCEQRAAETGARYVHSANEPLLIAGVGTYALEIFEELPNVDVVFVPIGGGSGACGLITVRNALGSRARIIGVGAAKADAVYRSWKGPQRVVGQSADTFAEGMATRVTFDLTFGIFKEHLDDFILLTEDELAAGVRLALARHPQPRRGRGRGGDCRGLPTPRRAGRAARGVRDERRQHRSGEAEDGPRINSGDASASAKASEKSAQVTTLDRLDRWKAGGVISADQHVLLRSLVRQERFSLFVEINALLYIGVLSVVGGLAWTVARLRRSTSATPSSCSVLGLLMAASFYYCFSRGLPVRQRRSRIAVDDFRLRVVFRLPGAVGHARPSSRRASRSSRAGRRTC